MDKFVSHNGGTPIKPVIDIMTKTLIDKKDYSTATKKMIHKVLRMSDDFEIMFNSGSSEGNATIVYSVALAYYKKFKHPAHVLISRDMLPAYIDTCQGLREQGMLKFNYIHLDKRGMINPSSIPDIIKSNTCLISIMHGNKYTSTIHHIETINKVAVEHEIPLHVDITNTIGTISIDCELVDVITSSLDRIHGPPGVGFMAILTEFIESYNLKFIMSDKDNHRTIDNLPGIAGAVVALKWRFTNRSEKTKNLFKMALRFLNNLSKTLRVRHIDKYINKYDDVEYPTQFVLLGLI